jgi:hypothetical protein
MLFAVVLGTLFIARRPDIARLPLFILGEHGNQLYRASRLLEGELLYRDVACQYGAIPVYLHAGLSAGLGVSINTVLIWHLSSSAAAVGLAYRVLRRCCDRTTSAFTTALFAVPMLLVPGGILGYSNVEYLSVERCCFLAVLAVWQLPEHRSRQVSVLLGGILGVWQHVKFGGAVFALAALLTVDIVVWLNAPSTLTTALKSWRRIIATFGVLQVVSVVAAYSFLPPDLAFDTVFPAYVAKGYPGADDPSRFPSFAGWPYFASTQLPMLCGLIAGAIVVFRTVLRARGARHGVTLGEPELLATAAALFYAFAATSYLRHVHLFYQYSWVFIFPVGYLAGCTRGIARYVLLLSALPATALLVKAAAFNSPIDHSRLELPDGDYVMASVADRSAIETIRQVCKKDDPNPAGEFAVASFGWCGGGVHYYFNKSYDLRNYMILPAPFRPYDEAELAAKWSKVSSLIWYNRAKIGPASAENLRVIFPRFADRIADEFERRDDLSTAEVTVFTRRHETNQ